LQYYLVEAGRAQDGVAARRHTHCSGAPKGEREGVSTRKRQEEGRSERKKGANRKHEQGRQRAEGPQHAAPSWHIGRDWHLGAFRHKQHGSPSIFTTGRFRVMLVV